jgi:hypothetical protein
MVDLPLEWTKLVLTAIGGAILLLVGIVQYVTTSSLSVRQPFLSKQMDLCLAAAEHAARLASTKDESQWKKSREEFWMLYYGPLAVVETVGEESKVASSMVAFGSKLKELESLPTPSLPADGLKGLALDIAHAGRDLLISKWNVRGIAEWLRLRGIGRGFR